MSSTKIKHLVFKKDETIIGFTSSEQPRDSKKVANDKDSKKCDLPRHQDFDFRLANLAPHLLIALNIREPKDVNGNFLQMSHFKEEFFNDEEEKDNFGGLTVTGILIQGKHASDGVQIFGTIDTPLGIAALKTPPIPLIENPTGYNYPLLKILDEQLDLLLGEADMYLKKKKHGAGVQEEIDLPPAKPDVNTKKVVKEEKHLALV